MLALTCVIALPGCQDPEHSTPAETAVPAETAAEAVTEAASMTEVPNLIGMDIRWAVTQCEECGLTVETEGIASDAEPNQVLSQSIAHGESVEPGTVIRLTYASFDTAAP